MTTDDVVTGLRIYVVIVASVVALLGTFQIKRWSKYLIENQLAWLALAFLNLSAFVGCLQSLQRHIEGGSRTWVVALAVTFELEAVAFHPARSLWRRWRVRRIVRRAARTHPTEETP